MLPFAAAPSLDLRNTPGEEATLELAELHEGAASHTTGKPPPPDAELLAAESEWLVERSASLTPKTKDSSAP